MGANGVVVSGRGVVKSFGATRALKGVDFTLRGGEIHALLGGNGAGKSTLIKILSGELDADAGLLDRDTSAIAVVHQELAIMADLSVAENLSLGFCAGSRLFPWRRSMTRTAEVLGMLGLDDGSISPYSRASLLPLHKLQLIEIGRALASGARVILLDEPTAALTSTETQRLFTVLRRLRDEGISFIFVSHRMEEIRQLADRLTILRDGATVVDGSPVADISDAEVLEGMFGQSIDRQTAERSSPATAAADAVLSLSHTFAQKRFDVRAGEVLGLAGAAVGPQNLINAVMGAQSVPTWRVELNNGEKPASPVRNPRDAIRRGIGYVSGDRAGKGLFPDLSIYDNALMAGQVVRKSWWRTPRERRRVDAQAARLGFAHQDLSKDPQSLSGGTQQKVLIARWVDLAIRVLVLEEPTRGVDLRTKNDLYDIVGALAEQGCAVIWWSTEFAELKQTCDRVLAFNVSGEPVDALPMNSLTEERLLTLTGTT